MFNLQETIVGTVERVTFYNPDNGYSVLKIRPEGKFPNATARDGTLAVVGTMPQFGVGERIQFSGTWIQDPRFGTQFKAERVVPIMPNTDEGIIAFLSSGIVKGVGQKTAAKIVDYFGSKTIEILDNDPERLYEIKSLKKEIARELIRTWDNNRTVRNTMIFLQGYGVTSKMANRIFQHYGPETISRVREDPYALADEVYGIGFIRADEIARAMGLPADDPNRIRAGLHYALNQLSKDGHTFVPRAELVAKTSELLRVEHTARIEATIAQQLFTGDLINETVPQGSIGDDAIYLPLYYYAERGAAKLITALQKEPSKIQAKAASIKWDGFLSRLSADQEVELTAQQQDAVRAALANKISVLTGGPGTGKTTTLRMVIHTLDALGYTYALASPTGRAAKRLSEATGQPARTIHRLLGYSPSEGGFQHDEDHPLEIDMLIVDETSMLDLLLFHDLLKALQPETHLMLVGDVDQLPSVGAGNVLRDVIDSAVAHVTRLDTIFRQSEDSHIVLNAHRINHGEFPFMDNRSSDFFFFSEEDPTAAAELIVDIVKYRLPDKFNIDPIADVQVIAPMYRGPIGVNALNESLQKALNGSASVAEKKIGSRTFRYGDKVMQTRNNYEKEVFNGDIGRISAIDFDDGELEVTIDGNYVYYDWSETEELIHAYCISTHRSQGSEYPIIVMPIMTQHYMMLQRNLLYTAITRAKRVVVLVGSRKAVYVAVNNNKVAQRYSGLLARLKALL